MYLKIRDRECDDMTDISSILNEKQIKYGFDYYHKDELYPPSIVEVSEYKGETSLTINCTQLGGSFMPQYKTSREKKRVLQEVKSVRIYISCPFCLSRRP